jgi:RNA polymerase sigma-70 factor (ECF subfamily)
LSETDNDLLRRCKTGDQAAWQELVSRHTRRVFGVAYRFTGRVDEAEDLTQDIFVKVYQNLDRFRESEGAFGAWLLTLARHQAIDHYRGRRIERLRQAEDPAVLERVSAPGDSALGNIERDERVRFVHRGLRALPAELRQVLILCDLEGVAYDEIARMLHLPLGTVKSRINRGRLELARRLLGQRQEHV